jgi:hypothetical protein
VKTAENRWISAAGRTGKKLLVNLTPFPNDLPFTRSAALPAANFTKD